MNIYSKTNLPAGFYVYAYLRANGTPYYIGKGKAKRAWDRSHIISVPEETHRILILIQNLTEDEALEKESFLIKWYGRKNNNTGILRNLTDGGKGGWDHIHSNKELSEKRINATKTALTGKKKTKEIIQKRLNTVKKNKSFSGENNPMFGKNHSNDTLSLIKQRASNRARVCRLSDRKEMDVSNFHRWNI
jgi:hypothetical protein